MTEEPNAVEDCVRATAILYGLPLQEGAIPTVAAALADCLSAIRLIESFDYPEPPAGVPADPDASEGKGAEPAMSECPQA